MQTRCSGVLLHITSLPSRFGIGDLGPQAYKFADLLAASRQTLWQMLPVNPTVPENSYSPYSCTSAFAGNWMLLSPDLLVADGLLDLAELDNAPSFDKDHVSFPEVAKYKRHLVDLACSRLRDDSGYDFASFCREHAKWLDDYATFKAFGAHRKSQKWATWPEGLRRRDDPHVLELKDKLNETIELVKIEQFLFFRQWESLKRYCNDRGIALLGDMPLYIAHETADVWANHRLFSLDEAGNMEFVSGVPSTSFNPEGQKWGTPLYDWQAHAQEGFTWWISRMRHNLRMFDWMRIDHFLGLVDFWAIPAKSKSALKGQWHHGPREDFFDAMYHHLPCMAIVAEDLGLSTADARELMSKYNLPGMRVMVDGFNEEPGKSYFLPHNHVSNCLVYTSTHDTHTVMGWYDNASSDQKRRLTTYLAHRPERSSLRWDFIRLAMSSVGRGVIIQMQDLLGLGEKSRMNRPGVPTGNWTWRMRPGAFTGNLSKLLAEVTITYGRYS